MFLFFFKALFVGILISFPIGPVGIICLRRTLMDGPLAGFTSGLGAATADALFTALAGLGMTVVSSFVLSHMELLRCIAGIILLILGGSILANPPQVARQKSWQEGPLASYLSTAVLTLGNPINILSLMAIFALAGLEVQSHDYKALFTLILGVFCGTAGWWGLMALLTWFFNPQFDYAFIRRVNLFSGILISICGVVSLALCAFGHFMHA